MEQYVGMGNQDKDIPPCLADTYARGTDIVATLARKAVAELSLSELKDDWLFEDAVSLMTTGVNGSRVQWLRGEWGLRIRMKAVGPRELEKVREILGLVRIEEFLVQPSTTAWLNLDLCVSARIRRER